MFEIYSFCEYGGVTSGNTQFINKTVTVPFAESHNVLLCS